MREIRNTRLSWVTKEGRERVTVGKLEEKQITVFEEAEYQKGFDYCAQSQALLHAIGNRQMEASTTIRATRMLAPVMIGNRRIGPGPHRPDNDDEENERDLVPKGGNERNQSSNLLRFIKIHATCCLTKICESSHSYS